MGGTSLDELRLDPAASVGWRNGPLDGMNCYMRAIEAALRHSGYSRRGVLEAFVTPVELVPRAQSWRPDLPMRGAWLDWDLPGDPWQTIFSTVTAGTPVLLFPDGYWWPGDMFEGTRNAFHHGILVIAVTPGSVRVLDTDAAESPGFVREYPVSERSRRAFARFAAIHPEEEPAALTDTELTGLLDWSRRTLEADLPGLEALAGRTANLAERDARSWDLVVLGHWQPQLYLLAEVLTVRGRDPGLATALRQAAAADHEFGTMLLGMHRYADATIYRSALPLLAKLVAALRRVLVELRAIAPADDLGPARVDRDVNAVLDEAYEWVFGQDASR